MTTEKLTVTGETLDFAIRKGLQKLGLSQDKTLIRVIQRDAHNLFGTKEAIIEIVYDNDESQSALKEKADHDFLSQFKFRFHEGQAQVKVPGCFYEVEELNTQEAKVQFLSEFLEKLEVDDPDEDALTQIADDYQSQYEYVTVKDLETEPLNRGGARIHLKPSDDFMHCRAIIFHGAGTTKEEVFEALKHRGFTKGVMGRTLDRVLEIRYGGYFTIAKGRPTQDDAPGLVEKYFQEDETKEFTRMMESLTIDTRSIKDINIAERNQLLLRVGEIVPGIDGRRIDGKTTKKKEVAQEECGINLGPNTYSSDNGKEVYARQSGHIVWKPDENFLDVEPVYIVEGNVDFSEGNIQGFVGKVIIKGDVKPKFKVVAHGDVEIQGTVEDALIRSTNGNVLILGSVINKAEGLIQASNTAHVCIATNANIKGKRIVIEKECMNSRLEAEDEIVVTGSPGVVIGGELLAKNLIQANTIGSDSGVATKIHVGDVEPLRDRLRALGQKISADSARLKEAEEVIKLLESKEGSGDLDSDQLHQLNKARAEVPELQDGLHLANDQEEELKREIASRRPARLEVLDTMHTQVDVWLFEAHVTTESEEKFTGFRCKDGMLQRYSL